jgi:hypothetical protein
VTTAPRHLPIEPDHVRALLRIASHRGQAQAHLTLHPAELGGVEVKLRVTTQGLVATVTADRPDAAQVLQQAGADLRRAFEAHGVEVAALDIGFAGDHDGRRATERRAEHTAPAAALDPTELPPTDDPSPNTTTIALGALVDVLA